MATIIPMEYRDALRDVLCCTVYTVVNTVITIICVGFFFPGFPINRGRHRESRGECVLSGPVSLWALDGEQTAVLRPGKLLEGNVWITEYMNPAAHSNSTPEAVIIVGTACEYWSEWFLCGLCYRFLRCGIRSCMCENSRMPMSSSPV